MVIEIRSLEPEPDQRWLLQGVPNRTVIVIGAAGTAPPPHRSSDRSTGGLAGPGTRRRMRPGGLETCPCAALRLRRHPGPAGMQCGLH
jgi:hypothetical protein